MPEFIENLNEWICNHPQEADLPISNDTLFVLDQEQSGGKSVFIKFTFCRYQFVSFIEHDEDDHQE